MADPKIAALEAVGVDVTEGLQYCRNNEKIFLKIIQKYAEDAENKIEEIKGYYENKDYENYEIQVHGLKSSSKTMGVMDVSELAKEQEFAAKEGNIAKIDADHQTLFDLYRERSQKILAALSGEVSEAGAAPAGDGIEKDKFLGKLKELAGLLDTFEATEAEKILDELLGYSFSDSSFSDGLKKVKSFVADFDMRAASAKVEEMLSSLG